MIQEIRTIDYIKPITKKERLIEHMDKKSKLAIQVVATQQMLVGQVIGVEQNYIILRRSNSDQTIAEIPISKITYWEIWD